MNMNHENNTAHTPKSGEKLFQADGFERCVCCHKKLNIPVNQPVEYRAFYIVGAGQLCCDCWREIYGPKIRKGC